MRIQITNENSLTVLLWCVPIIPQWTCPFKVEQKEIIIKNNSAFSSPSHHQKGPDTCPESQTVGCDPSVGHMINVCVLTSTVFNETEEDYVLSLFAFSFSETEGKAPACSTLRAQFLWDLGDGPPHVKCAWGRDAESLPLCAWRSNEAGSYWFLIQLSHPTDAEAQSWERVWYPHVAPCWANTRSWACLPLFKNLPHLPSQGNSYVVPP